MTRRLLPRLMGGAVLLLGALALAAPAAAQASAPLPLQDGAEEMYQQALQSIAEGRKNDASATLQRVIEREPLHAGAWLDLALIQCGLGHADEAERLFAAIEARFAPPPGISALIARARADGCANWQPRSAGSISFGRGIDQNVNQGSSSATYTVNQFNTSVELPLLPDFLPRHDQYSVLAADYSRDLSPNGSVLFAQFQNRRHDTLHAYDSTSLFAGIDTPWRRGVWTLRGSGMLGLITLGGHPYQRQAQFQAQLGRPLAGGLQFNLTAGATRFDYLTLDNFNANSAELRSQLSYRDDNNYVSASLAYQKDLALGARPGGDRSGNSATLQWRRNLGNTLSGELSYNYQGWRSSSAYSPGLIDEVRHQETSIARIALAYALSRAHSLQLELRQVRNEENISIFQYNSRQLQLNWQWQWP